MGRDACDGFLGYPRPARTRANGSYRGNRHKRHGPSLAPFPRENRPPVGFPQGFSHPSDQIGAPRTNQTVLAGPLKGRTRSGPYPLRKKRRCRPTAPVARFRAREISVYF